MRDGAASAAVAAAKEVAAGTLAARTGTYDVAAAAASGEAAAASALADAEYPNQDPAAAMNLGEAAAAGALTGAADPKSNPAGLAELADAAAAIGQAAGLASGLGSGLGSGAPPSNDGSIPAGVLALPPPLSTAAAINQLDKDVQVCTMRVQDFIAYNSLGCCPLTCGRNLINDKEACIVFACLTETIRPLRYLCKRLSLASLHGAVTNQLAFAGLHALTCMSGLNTWGQP